MTSTVPTVLLRQSHAPIERVKIIHTEYAFDSELTFTLKRLLNSYFDYIIVNIPFSHCKRLGATTRPIKQLKFPPDIASTTLRPDVLLLSRELKRLVLMELTVLWEDIIMEALERKGANTNSYWMSSYSKM